MESHEVQLEYLKRHARSFAPGFVVGALLTLIFRQDFEYFASKSLVWLVLIPAADLYFARKLLRSDEPLDVATIQYWAYLPVWLIGAALGNVFVTPSIDDLLGFLAIAVLAFLLYGARKRLVIDWICTLPKRGSFVPDSVPDNVI